MNDRSPVVPEIFELNSLLLTQICFKLVSSFVLAEIDNSTVCLPLLYSAMKHSTLTKAQKDISHFLRLSVNGCF